MKKRSKYKIIKQNKGWFKKGSEPTNKGQHMYHSGSFKIGHQPYLGIEMTQFKKTGITFQGSNKEYKALHFWVYKHLGKPLKCKKCGDSQRRIEWANKSHEYKRELNDWIELCVKCHREYDRKDTCESN